MAGFDSTADIDSSGPRSDPHKLVVVASSERTPFATEFLYVAKNDLCGLGILLRSWYRSPRENCPSYALFHEIGLNRSIVCGVILYMFVVHSNLKNPTITGWSGSTADMNT